jgi:hypothetical protein
MGKDLGTYYLRVELENGDGWIERWRTGHRFTLGTYSTSPLNAEIIPPTWENEEDLFHCMEYMFMEGNYSCDCNKVLFLAWAHQQPEPKEPPCGENMPIKRMTAIKPDASEVVIFEAKEE